MVARDRSEAEARRQHPAEPAGDAAQLPGRQLLRGAQALVDGGEHHVGEQLGVLGVDRLRIDADLLDLKVAGDDDPDHPAAGGGLDALVLERRLRGLHVLLHLLHLLEHLLHVRRLGHQAWRSSSGSSSASNSSRKCLTSSSSESLAAAAGSPPSSARSSYASRTTWPLTVWIAPARASRLGASSAFRLRKARDSEKATVSSSRASAIGLAPSSSAASIEFCSRTVSSTAGHSERIASRSRGSSSGWSASTAIATAAAPLARTALSTRGPGRGGR